jgi:hypothetical protein
LLDRIRIDAVPGKTRQTPAPRPENALGSISSCRTTSP